MIQLNKLEKSTLREISQWETFFEHWRPKTRAKLVRMGFVENVAPEGQQKNFQLTDRGKTVLAELVDTGAFN
ncbi:TPA: hypothetical protein ACKE3U_003768 [Klebsiella aerogenes]